MAGAIKKSSVLKTIFRGVRTLFAVDKGIVAAKSPCLRIAVILPAINEEENIGSVLARLKVMGLSSIIVVDGESKDNTIILAIEKGAIVIPQNGRGKGNAILQIPESKYLNFRFLDVDAVVLMDADGSMIPEEIPRFLAAIQNGAEIVRGSRFIEGGYTHDMSLVRRVGNTFFTWLVNLLWNTSYTDMCYGYVAFTKKALDRISPALGASGFEIETEISIKAKKLGLTIKEVPIIELRRKSGRSNLNVLKDGLRILRLVLSEFLRQQA